MTAQRPYTSRCCSVATPHAQRLTPNAYPLLFNEKPGTLAPGPRSHSIQLPTV